MKMVSEKERKRNISMDCMCSHCGGYADIVVHNKIKLCNPCLQKQLSDKEEE